MKASRELDALVAEKVMGYVILTEWGWLTRPELKDQYPARKFHTISPKPYSTDIAAAWEVVEKLYASKNYCCINLRHPTCEPIEFELIEGGNIEHEPRYDAQADTAPLAICLAALKAVGHK